MSSLRFPKLRAQWGLAGAGNIVEAAVIQKGVSIFLPTQNAHVVRLNGRRFDSQTLRLQLPGEEFCIASTHRHRWFSMFIPDEVVADRNVNKSAPIGFSSGFIHLSTERAEVFHRAIAQLESIVYRAPNVFQSSPAVNVTTRKLTELLRQALGGNVPNTSRRGRPSISRKAILDSVMGSVEKHDCDCLSIEELATEAGISQRTLRAMFQEYFGMGPVQYLKRRMLNLVRKALQDSDSSVATVTQIAAEFGVWELGRFAHDYRALFDELPSETLYRAH